MSLTKKQKEEILSTADKLANTAYVYGYAVAGELIDALVKGDKAGAAYDVLKSLLDKIE